MAYSDFTFEILLTQFHLQVREERDAFAGCPPRPISDLLRQTLRDTMSLALETNTEKARSEFIIAPVLAEVRRQMDYRLGLFSGVEFNVDPAQGLRGTCDFLLSLSPLQLIVQAPVVMVVEAKNENLKPGLSQCVAEMVAAQQFNQGQQHTIPELYGAVTSGSVWRFLALSQTAVVVDATEYYISAVEQVVGILVAMIQTAASQQAMHAHLAP